jgi:hypothetical protein
MFHQTKIKRRSFLLLLSLSFSLFWMTALNKSWNMMTIWLKQHHHLLITQQNQWDHIYVPPSFAEGYFIHYSTISRRSVETTSKFNISICRYVFFFFCPIESSYLVDINDANNSHSFFLFYAQLLIDQVKWRQKWVKMNNKLFIKIGRCHNSLQCW